ncbi:MAG: flagella basal body P-ring formation protein FlgA [Spirochaetota bacterium]|nr:flagella basal body P-ring formation protein FlgA [Spirochaetota bacterium]
MFLYPKIHLKKKAATLEDIAVIDCGKESINRFKHIKIPHVLYSDGYLDRKEIRLLIRQSISKPVFIYGNAIKINVNKEVEGEKKDNTDDPMNIVKSGERVKIVVINNGIFVELIGTALKQGSIGDEIRVRIKGSKVIHGIVKRGKLVEVTL